MVMVKQICGMLLTAAALSFCFLAVKAESADPTGPENSLTDGPAAASACAVLLPEEKPDATVQPVKENDPAPETECTRKDRFYLKEIPLAEELQAHTWKICQEEAVDYALVLALMYQESRFQDDVTGYNTNGTTDGGLMQLNSRYAEYLCQRFGADDLRDPYQNIEVGVRLLASYIRPYGEHDALLAYHMGEGTMLSLKESGQETTDYAQAILCRRGEYRAALEALQE